MTRFAVLAVLLLLCLVGCGPLPTAQAQTGATIAPGDNAALLQSQATQAAYYAGATQAARQREAAQAATAQANTDRAYALEATAQAQAAQQEAQRLAMEAQAQQATLAARSTTDALAIRATEAAITAAATAQAMQATAQAAQAYAAATQAASEAIKAAVTADANRLRASQEALLSADQTAAEQRVIRAGPTMTAQAQQASQRRLDRWSMTGQLVCGGLALLAGLVGLLQAWRWSEAKRRDLAARTPRVTRLPDGGILAWDGRAWRTLPATGEAPPALVEISPTPVVEDTPIGRFLVDCARLNGWDSRDIPSHRDFRKAGIEEWDDPRPWTKATKPLADAGLIVKGGGADNSSYVVANDGTLRDMPAALPYPSDGDD